MKGELFTTIALVCSQALDAVEQADPDVLKANLTEALRAIGQAADIEAERRGAVPQRLKSEWENSDANR